MLIKWTFLFEQTHFAVEVREQAEDERMLDQTVGFTGYLAIPSPGKDIYINLPACKAILREEINENQPEAAP